MRWPSHALNSRRYFVQTLFYCKRLARYLRRRGGRELQSRGRVPRANLLELGRKLPASNLHVISRLRTQPIAIRQTKKRAKPQVSIGRDGAPSEHNLPNALRGHANFLGKTILRNPQRLEKLFFKKLPPELRGRAIRS